jgi:membrane protein implicated in regulation of membrane protease activity
MGAAPSLVWASGALFAAAFVVLVPVAIWIYAVVFAFTALWFTHFGLAALHDLRRESDAANATGALTGDTLRSLHEPKQPPP